VSNDGAISAVAALDDELRHGMYVFIRRVRRPVTRDEAAAAVGISRKLAAFHLDKLVKAGVLRSRTEAVGGIRRVGRTPKVYEPADTDIRVTIPERRHEILAEILVDAVLSEETGETAQTAALRAAATHGEALGTASRDPNAQDALSLAEAVLTTHGFEPARPSPTCVQLRNCPFHPLATRAPDLVCGINLAFLQGLLHGLKTPTLHAILTPRAGECCVELRTD
jgi:predicted ArsR family transcriptional regulator